MHLVVADTADVVLRRGLVAPVALIHLSYATALGHLRILLARHLLRHHLEMHHVVTGWSLVALRATGRLRRGVLELGHGPLRRRVALRAVFAQQSHVPVFGGVASHTIQGLAGRAGVELPRDANA